MSEDRTVVSEDLIYVAMLPQLRDGFEEWLAQHGLKIGRIPPMGDPVTDQIPIYLVTPIDWPQGRPDDDEPYLSIHSGDDDFPPHVRQQ